MNDQQAKSREWKDGDVATMADLKVCGGTLEWEEYRSIRQRALIDGLRRVFDPSLQRDRTDERP